MNLPRLFLTPAAIAAFLLAAVAPTPLRAAPPVDLNADGIPDIWAMRYSSAALAPDADTDGDGQKNSAEALAGTNPLQSGSVIKITSITSDGSGVHLTFPTELGKRYQIQTSPTLVTPTWTNLGTPLAPDQSGILTATNNAPDATTLFHRVSVVDIDSDGDGVNDWEEMQIGFDPYNSHSKGLNGPNDLAAITSALGAPNVVSVSSTEVPIAEPAAPDVSTDVGTFTITRTGNLNAITVNYSVSGSATPGSDYVALSGSVTLGMGVNSATVTVTPLPDAVLESPEAVIITISPSASYTVGSPAAAAVLINDYTQANGTGLTAKFWEEGSTVLSQTVLPTFTGTVGNWGVIPGLNQTTSSWGTTNVNGTHPNRTTPLPAVNIGTDGYWSARYTGEVLPQYSQLYTFSLETNFAGRLYVNGKLVVNNWPPVQVLKSSNDDAGTPTANRAYGDIELQAGVRAPIVVEFFQDAGTGRCYLRWESANQLEEYIPAERLFPTAPPQITSALSVLLLKNSPPYNYQILASSSPTSYGAVNLPPGWTFNATTGVISGTPTQVGKWQVPITATNALGSGSAILEINVIATDGGITRDVWTGVTGSAVSDIPLTTAPTSTSIITSLEGPQNADDNYGSRIRGYLTAPTTGTYQFWLTADDAAELWISDDEEPVNAFKRAALTSPVGYRNWAVGAVSSLLYLEGGTRYYVEVRHKEGTGTDHVSVGWLKPGGTAPADIEVVPAYALSQYVAPAIVPGESTLYATSLTAQSGAVTSGYGSATLRVSADESVATLRFTFANLTTNLLASGRHIHADPQAHGGAIIFDIDTATANADGSYTWIIPQTSGALTKADILNDIHNGVAYLNIHTATYPAGEIRGFFTLQAASQTFTPPPAPPAWTDDHTDANAASRFLMQTTFGPTSTEITAVQSGGYDAWLESQFLVPSTHHLDFVIANRNTTNPDGPTYYTDLTTNAWWKASVTGPDQLRQRIAFALSEILVVSTAGPLEDNARAVSSFYDKLLDDAFGNFRTILEDVTLTPAMGIYLDMRRNDKPNLVTGAHPNENYAREIKQLFSIGLNRMHPDGTLVLNSKGELIPTYGQDEIIGFAHAFTGWDYHQNMVSGLFPTGFAGASDYINPMTEIPEHHFTGQKRILNRVVLPGLATAPGATGTTVALDPYADHTKAPYSRTNTINNAAYQALPAQDLDATHDALFNHPNCPPFICRQLIQRLVTSTPSPGYIYRVVSKFENNGAGVRGDMKAVIKAILLDYEARSPAVLTQQGHGKQREPVLRVSAVARAFAPPASLSGTYVQDGGVITVDTAPTLHRLVSGNPVALSFTGAAPQATSGNYSLTGTFPNTATAFSVRAQDVIRSTYTQTGTTVSVVTGSGATGSVDHGLVTGDSAYVRFRDGVGKPADGVFPVTVTGAKLFTVTVPTTATIATAANCDVAILRGAYSQRGTTITLTTGGIHGLTTGANLTITFIGNVGAPSLPAAGTYPVTVVDDTHLTITAVDSVNRDGTFKAAADVMVLNRSGAATTAFSNWTMGGSDTDIAQTPLRSPTVFNFFLPDYQFPGVTANAGLVTPEFQLTSETNVIRSANFLYDGIFNPSGNSSGFSSFRGGGGDIGLDFSPWMANGPGGVPWTNTVNLNALIDQLNTLLMGGLLDSTGTNNYATNPRTILNAKQAIFDYVSNTSNIAYATASPTDAQKMARIRAVIHLIVTSPDFTIQK